MGPHRHAHEVEPIRRGLQIATLAAPCGPAAQARVLCSPRARRDQVLAPRISNAWGGPGCRSEVPGRSGGNSPEKTMGGPLRRRAADAPPEPARRDPGQGASAPRTTIADSKVPCPPDRVEHPFGVDGPNPLWASDFTEISTRREGMTFVIDVDARRVVDWLRPASSRPWAADRPDSRHRASAIHGAVHGPQDPRRTPARCGQAQ